MTAARLRLQDAADGPPRTTDTMVASLAERLATLRVVTGADAFGSLAAGYAAVGRQAASSSDGARLHDALTHGPAAARGQAIWSALGIDTLADTTPSPVLEHLRNDMALLLAGDVEDALTRARDDVGQRGMPTGDTDEPATFVDYLVGMWAFARELTAWVEAVAATSSAPAGAVHTAAAPEPPSGPLLR